MFGQLFPNKNKNVTVPIPNLGSKQWLCLDPNFGVPKYTVAFRLYLVIIVQPLTN
jgi:hypothetical protein